MYQNVHRVLGVQSLLAPLHHIIHSFLLFDNWPPNTKRKRAVKRPPFLLTSRGAVVVEGRVVVCRV